MDVLDHFESLKVCTAYRVNGVETKDFPTDANLMDKIEPVYEDVPGWNSDTTKLTEYQDLPEAARNYVKLIEDFLESHSDCQCRAATQGHIHSAAHLGPGIIYVCHFSRLRDRPIPGWSPIGI